MGIMVIGMKKSPMATANLVSLKVKTVIWLILLSSTLCHDFFLYQDNFFKIYEYIKKHSNNYTFNGIVQINLILTLAYTESGLSVVILLSADDVVYFGVVDKTSSFVTSL